jgi:hypothetical protein
MIASRVFETPVLNHVTFTPSEKFELCNFKLCTQFMKRPSLNLKQHKNELQLEQEKF